MGSEDVKRDISKSHTITVDDGDWYMDGEMPEFRERVIEIGASNALARKEQQDVPKPRYGHLPKGFFG